MSILGTDAYGNPMYIDDGTNPNFGTGSTGGGGGFDYNSFLDSFVGGLGSTFNGIGNLINAANGKPATILPGQPGYNPYQQQPQNQTTGNNTVLYIVLVVVVLFVLLMAAYLFTRK